MQRYMLIIAVYIADSGGYAALVIAGPGAGPHHVVVANRHVEPFRRQH